MEGQGSSQFFSHSTNLVISGGTFTSVINPTTSKVNALIRPSGPGFKLLLDKVSQGAFHDAAERGDPPRCHPRTRLAIRAEIMEWIKAPRSMKKLILWMYGPAGSGKTAIAQTIAEECERLGLLAASFFFWRSSTGRNNADRFIATLAYQLSRYLPQIENHLFTAIERDPAIFSRSLSTQMRVLVIEPLKHVVPSSSMQAMVAIVDGVDECGPDGQSQSDVLYVLGSIASELQHLPVMFFIASRPEYEIREAFNGNHLSSLTKVLVLDNNYKPDEDIKLYFDITFREICQRNHRLGCRLPSPWPTPENVNFLVSKASGQFIFASTVIKFIDSPRHNASDRLNMILRLSNTGNETPFAPLDALYRFILGSVADIEKVLHVLMLILLGGEYLEHPKMHHAEELLGFDIRRALIDMHALLFVPPPTDSSHLPRIHHASLSDFLMDRSRSLEYYIGESQGHVNLCRLFLRLIGPCDLPQVPYRLPVIAFVYHFRRLNSPANQEVMDELARFDLRAALERISDFSKDIYETHWTLFMKYVQEQGGRQGDVFLRLQKEFNSFILARLDQYPPSLKPYIPILISKLQGRGDMFNILLHAVTKSVEEVNELREVDKNLLDVSSVRGIRDVNNTAQVMRDAARAGQHSLDGGSYAAFIKTIVNVICLRSFGRNNRIMFLDRNDDQDHLEESAVSTAQVALWDRHLFWFEEILEYASTDLDLAYLLREHTIQFRNDVAPMPGRRRVAEASIKYIQRCGIPFLKHTHQPHINECAICTLCNGAVVITNIPVISREPPPLPLPTSEFSDANMESILAFVDVFKITGIPYPFTYML